MWTKRCQQPKQRSSLVQNGAAWMPVSVAVYCINLLTWWNVIQSIWRYVQTASEVAVIRDVFDGVLVICVNDSDDDGIDVLVVVIVVDTVGYGVSGNGLYGDD